eukprot:TRINITY_DN2508_c0_g1_i1.p1 TRINITY_DN2508_c0_g1~~TRINITY_DN2508_c0_g1_i1.p1  ORF type:complete len:402 (+),score=105.92 TRINITY_DN2508_c0_g1_i1:495-1700(+)
MENKGIIIKETILKDFLMKINETNVKTVEFLLTDSMIDCKFSPTDDYFAIADLSGQVLIFDTENGSLIQTLKDHSEPILGLAFSRDNKYFATCSHDKTANVYRLNEEFLLLHTLHNNFDVTSICFSIDSNYLFTGDSKGFVKKWNVIEERVVKNAQVHSDNIYKLRNAWNDKFLLSGSDDNYGKLIDSEGLSVISTFEHESCVRAIAFHPSNEIVATGEFGNTIKIWNLDETNISTLHLNGAVFALEYASSSILISMSGDRYLTLFSTAEYQEIQKVFCNCENTWFSFALSVNKHQLVCGKCENDSFKIYKFGTNYSNDEIRELIVLSEGTGNVLNCMIHYNCEASTIREIITNGVFMNREEFSFIVDLCWDLSDINKKNGGNMYQFLDLDDDKHNDSDFD